MIIPRVLSSFLHGISAATIPIYVTSQVITCLAGLLLGGVSGGTLNGMREKKHDAVLIKKQHETFHTELHVFLE